MREYVRTKNVKEGDILAKTIYDDKARLLLKEGNKITNRLINTITELGYKGIYIDNNSDERRENIPIAEPLLDDLETIRIVDQLSELMKRLSGVSDALDSVAANYRKILEDHIEEIVDKMSKLYGEQSLVYETEDNRVKRNWIQYHSLNTALISIGIALNLKLPKEQVYNIGVGALYHDIGKFLVDSRLVDKEKLTESEKEDMRKHPEKAFRLLQRLNYPVDTTYAVWFHHEHCDGTGYPNKLQSDKIPLAAKIVSLASAYDNLINYTPYSDKPLYQIDALHMLSADSRFDTECVGALLRFVTPYPSGSKAKLSNNQEAIVLKNVPDLMERPHILIGKDLISLATDKNYRSVTIVKLIEQ